MDLFKAIRELYEEKRRIDEVIERLEALSLHQDTGASPPPQKKRGRKSMSDDERAEVSQRMRQYWAARRKKAKAAGSGA